MSLQDLSISRYVDPLTPAILTVLAAGTHVAKATLSSTDSRRQVTRLDLVDVVVTSLSTGGSGTDRRTENLTLSFAKVTVTVGPASAVVTA